MKRVAVVPARYASTRFPGKPLARKTGKYLVQHVWERVSAARHVDQVIVATDDQRIAAAVRSFGGEARLTHPDHRSGTHRVAEVARACQLDGDDIVVNVQGDEPEIDPAHIDGLVTGVEHSQWGAARIATLATRFRSASPRTGPGSPADPHCVKVVVNNAGLALYFSRSLIPYPHAADGNVQDPSRWLLHVGVYAFRMDALQAVAGRHPGEQSPLRAGGMGHDAVKDMDAAACESLEQLQWMLQGHAMGVIMVEHGNIGIDTPDDYAAFVRRCEATMATATSEGEAGTRA